MPALDDRTLLALSALTYRGYASPSEKAIATKLELALPQLEREQMGTWRVAWGPETFRAPTSLVDDVMAVALEERRAPGDAPRFAVAIRGTNPISAFDWVFGDLWVDHLVAWPGAAPGDAKLSASTHLGLAVIQSLGRGDLALLGTEIAVALREYAERLPELDPQRLLAEPDGFDERALLARLRELSGPAGERLRDGASARLGAFLGHAADRSAGALGVIAAAIRARSTPGRTLLDFVETLPAGARLDVAGHSKGGALAIATALWLHEAWGAAHGLEIHCTSFAGPTAGNAAFAERYDAALAARTRRIVNPRDLVPAAWRSGDLRRIGRSAYPTLRPALETIAAAVAPLGYAHVGGASLDLAPRPGERELVGELIHQHLDAYLEAAGLAPGWSASSIFLG